MSSVLVSASGTYKLCLKTDITLRIGPKDIMFAGKDSIQKILVEVDLKKAPFYETAREDTNVASLFTETDKVKYKHKVCIPPRSLVGLH